METINYKLQAENFLTKTQTSFTAEFVKYDKHFPDDTGDRDIYRITLQHDQRKYVFKFGQSIRCSGKYWLLGDYRRGVAQKPKFPISEWDKNKDFAIPTAYDVLVCVQKYNPGTFENFCSDFGYDTDSRKAESVYKVVKDEYQNIAMLYNENEIALLQEIQ